MHPELDFRRESLRTDTDALNSGVLTYGGSLRTYTLSELLTGVTSENIHGGVDMGAPTGQELL